jgi:hypothetical protein
MDVLELIARLDRLADSAKKVPRSDHVRMNRQEVRDILDQMRATIPAEIKEARWIARERQDMLAEARREADRIDAETREQQTELVSRHELVVQAERAAEQIVENARSREREIRLGAETRFSTRSGSTSQGS